MSFTVIPPPKKQASALNKISTTSINIPAPSTPKKSRKEEMKEQFMALSSDDEKKMKLKSMILKGDELLVSEVVADIVHMYGIFSSYGVLVQSEAIPLIKISETTVRNQATSVSIQRGLQLILSIATHGSTSMNRGLEPLIVRLVPDLLIHHSDRSNAVRDLSTNILTFCAQSVNPNAFRLLFPMILDGIAQEDWRVKVAGLNFLKALAPRVSKQITLLLPLLIPKVSECITDSKRQVQIAAMEAMTASCTAILNDDIRPLVPLLVSVIAKPDESTNTLNALLETTFVASVDSSVLALIAPLLGKALRGRSSVLKRKAAKVIDIMCRLVQEPSDVAPFLPLLLPALDKVIDEIVDAEVCDVAKEARRTLIKSMGHGVAKMSKGNGTFAATETSSSKLALPAVSSNASISSMHSMNSRSVSSLTSLEDQGFANNLSETLLSEAEAEALVVAKINVSPIGLNYSEVKNEMSSAMNQAVRSYLLSHVPSASTSYGVLESKEEAVEEFLFAVFSSKDLFSSPTVSIPLSPSEITLETLLSCSFNYIVDVMSLLLVYCNPLHPSLAAPVINTISPLPSNTITRSPSVTSLTSIDASNYSSTNKVIENNKLPVDAMHFIAEGSDSIPNSVLWRYAVSMTSMPEWKDAVVPFVDCLLDELRKRFSVFSTTDGPNGMKHPHHQTPGYGFAYSYRMICLGSIPDYNAEVEVDESQICNIEFSLAFGGKILLQNSVLKLSRGRRYALMGKNGAGKTTLLTNLGSGNIEGVPSTLRMVYVQHDDQSDDKGLSIVEELVNAPENHMVRENASKEEAAQALKAIGFTDTMLSNPRSTLSGGWKMKLLIIKAMLSKANVLLLDEPTNHLDAASVAWLTHYLQNQKDITALIVSHDTAFLDNVVTDIIHYENKKLVYYVGNLTHFVSIHPEAKYYYELSSSSMTFKFPTPERLEGINSTTRAIMRMENISYTYPGASKPTLKNCSVKVCLGSRIAVLGANGAGKSTLIKLLVQETEPDPGSGEVWKHRNMRLAYVAQHSFHHIEQHLDITPVQYIKWRFAGGVDREDLARPNMKLTDEEVQEFKGERKFGEVIEVLGRRKNGRTMEYECTFVGQTKRDPNKYISLEKMTEMGLLKLVQQTDTRIAAAAAGLDLRPLVTLEIQNHLNDFNLDAEFGTHGTIRRLSGGQKVKLVLAAAMWNKPHVLVLDEPTNYLDREALGALTQAIKGFAGGIVIISHNSEFTDAICTEKWHVHDGQCFTKGDAEDMTLKSSSMKKSKSSASVDNAATADGVSDEGAGNINKSISSEIVLNPKTLEALTKKEVRKLERCAQVAGMSLKDYVLKINCKSPEWKWL